MPKRISFKVGGVITGIIGILMMPWALLANPHDLHLQLAGDVLGIPRPHRRRSHRRLLGHPEEEAQPGGPLHGEGGEYTFSGGFNVKAVIALLAGIIVALIGLVVKPLHFLLTMHGSWDSQHRSSCTGP